MFRKTILAIAAVAGGRRRRARPDDRVRRGGGKGWGGKHWASLGPRLALALAAYGYTY